MSDFVFSASEAARRRARRLGKLQCARPYRLVAQSFISHAAWGLKASERASWSVRYGHLSRSTAPAARWREAI